MTTTSSSALRPGWATTSWATCTSSPPTLGWKDFGGVMAPSRIVQTRGGWPFFEVDVTAAQANPADLATLAPAPAGRGGGPGGGAAPAAGGRGGPGGPAAPPALTVTSEKLGDGVYRLTTGAGSYDSLDRGLPRPHHDARGGAERGAGARLHRRSEDAHPQQADPVRDEHACARRSHRRVAGHGGRRRHHHHAEEQRDVLQPGAEHAENAPERQAGDQSQRRRRSKRCRRRRSTRMEREGSSSTTSTPPRTRTG